MSGNETALARRHRLSLSLRTLPGYAGPGRKTLSRRHRTPAHLLPDWETSFEIPGTFALGATTVRAKSKAWVLDRVVAILREAAPFGLLRPVALVLVCAAHGTTPPKTEECTIQFDGRNASLISGASMRQIV